MSPRADGAGSDPREIELKMAVLDLEAIRAIIADPAASLPGVVPLAAPREVDLEDRYLDTERGLLRRAGLVARIRVTAGSRRLTVKSTIRRGAGIVHDRLELEGDAGGIEATGDIEAGDDPRRWPASDARDRILAQIGGESLFPIAILRQHRFQRDIRVEASLVELSLDEVEAAGAGLATDRWTELEAELRSGTESDLATLGAMLLRRADLAPATASKLERALERRMSLVESGLSTPARILVLCTGNSCRSQMAEAFLARAGGDRVTVVSAGTNPSTVHPMTVRVLAERGVDWSGARSKSMTEFIDEPFDIVVTVCDEAAEACPVFPGEGRRIHRSFRDPALSTGSDAERMEVFREVRDEVEAWAAGLLAEVLAPP